MLPFGVIHLFNLICNGHISGFRTIKTGPGAVIGSELVISKKPKSAPLNSKIKLRVYTIQYTVT